MLTFIHNKKCTLTYSQIRLLTYLLGKHLTSRQQSPWMAGLRGVSHSPMLELGMLSDTAQEHLMSNLTTYSGLYLHSPHY